MSLISYSRNISFAFFLIFFVVFVVAFSTPFWTKLGKDDSPITYGLWSKCLEELEHCRQIGHKGDAAFSGARAMMCIALIFYSGAFVSYCVWISKDRQYLRMRGAGPIGMAALILTLTGGIFNLLGTIIYAFHDNKKVIGIHGKEWFYLDGSFICATLSGALQVANILITLPLVLCCHKPDVLPNDATATAAPSDLATALNEQPKMADKTTEANCRPAGSLPLGQQQTTMASYPMTVGHPQAVAGYPPSAGYPPPMGYPQPGAYPSAAGFVYPNVTPNEYGPPPAYEKEKSNI